jgi:hypothetical protein
MHCYIIHSSNNPERDGIVKDLQEKTNATVVEAVWDTNHVKGCSSSHLAIAWMAKQQHPEEGYFVFEDDCILTDSFQGLPPLDCDLLYLGYTNKDPRSDMLYGSHALGISPAARDALLEHAYSYVCDNIPYDHILYHIQIQCNLSRHAPVHSLREAIAYQARGFLSSITGKIRI